VRGFLKKFLVKRVRCNEKIRGKDLEGLKEVYVKDFGIFIPVPERLDPSFTYMVACCRGRVRDREGHEKVVHKAKIIVVDTPEKRTEWR